MSTDSLIRVHDRIDETKREVAETKREVAESRLEMVERLGAIQTEIAKLVAEGSGVRATVEAMRLSHQEHDKRIAALEHDKSRMIGALLGAGVAGGGIGAVIAQALGYAG